MDPAVVSQSVNQQPQGLWEPPQVCKRSAGCAGLGEVLLLLMPSLHPLSGSSPSTVSLRLLLHLYLTKMIWGSKICLLWAAPNYSYKLQTRTPFACPTRILAGIYLKQPRGGTAGWGLGGGEGRRLPGVCFY